MGQSQGRPIVITDEVKLDHFKLLRVVGKGAFGKVRIVERKDSGLTFALKYIRKDEVVRSENVRNIVRERRMLEHLNHPFLCNLRYSFQDYDYLYLVVDLMSGGDLRFHISRKYFTEATVRFWIAELGCALRYVHQQGIVHRDVKPDNVLLDSGGHVHLADFNVASDFTANKKLTSKSGTLAYLAPEVYEGKGYRSEVDWWSLGVVFYECIYNKRPFDARTHEELAEQIKAASPKYPRTNPPLDASCTSMMKRLLTKSLDDRLGANGFENFTSHPFFANADLNFDMLEKRQVEPIFKPATDKTNFDATYDLEELLLEEAPLEARTKHMKPRAQPKADATPQEKRAAELYGMIERLFEPFDYTVATFDKIGDSSVNDSVTAPETTLSTDSVTGGPSISMNAQPESMMPDQSRHPSRAPSTRAPSTNLELTDTGSPPLTSQMSISAMAEATSSANDIPPVPTPPAYIKAKASTSTTTSQLRPPKDRQPSATTASVSSTKSKTKKSFLGILSTKKDREAASKKIENGVMGKGARPVLE